MDFSQDQDYRDSLDGLIVSGEWLLPDRLAVIKCSQQGIPTFHFMDGILEWRNLFENPRSTDASRGSPLYQPILSDFTFCLGQLQKLQLEWLGNSNVVASGLPRLGCEKIATSRRQNHPSTRSVLIATANTPWFTDEQKLEFCREFVPFYERCRDQSEFSIKWRLAPSLWNELGKKIQRLRPICSMICKASIALSALPPLWSWRPCNSVCRPWSSIPTTARTSCRRHGALQMGIRRSR